MISKECKRLAEVDFPIAKALKRVVQDLPAALQREHRPGGSRSAIRRVTN